MIFFGGHHKTILACLRVTRAHTRFGAAAPRPSTDSVSHYSSCTCHQVMMRWNERPRRALVLLKPDRDLLPLAVQTIDYLQRDMGLNVMVETAAAEAVGQVMKRGYAACLCGVWYMPLSRYCRAVAGMVGWH